MFRFWERGRREGRGREEGGREWEEAREQRK